MRRGWWAAVLAVAVVEVVAHATIRSRVPSEGDWRAAASHVREHHQPSDAIVVAPSWADPLLRLSLGDRISFAAAAPSDLEGNERLWIVSIRGARSEWAPDRPADESARFGRVTVERWDLGPSNVVYDFVDNVQNAEVQWVQGGRSTACTWRSTFATGGNLGAGPLTPADRFVCPGARPWIWVGATVTEDLDLKPRHCIWQHPAGVEPVRATFRDVPLGEAMTFFGGIYYEHERMRENGPVEARVYVGGELVGHMTHRDGDGWKRMAIDPRGTPAGDVTRADVTVEVTARAPHLRTFCWSARMLREPPGSRGDGEVSR
jgi:hypothetical protein